MEENENNEIEYEIVNGDGELNISPVYTQLNINHTVKDDSDKKKNIVIPEEKKK